MHKFLLAASLSLSTSLGLSVALATNLDKVKPQLVSQPENPVVKRSLAGLCHSKESQYFNYVIHYTAYDSLTQCVLEGGRLPKRVKENVRNFDYTGDTYPDSSNVQ